MKTKEKIISTYSLNVAIGFGTSAAQSEIKLSGEKTMPILVEAKSSKLSSKFEAMLVQQRSGRGNYLIGKAKIGELLAYVDVPSLRYDLAGNPDYAIWLKSLLPEPNKWQRVISPDRAYAISRSVEEDGTLLLEPILLALNPSCEDHFTFHGNTIDISRQLNNTCQVCGESSRLFFGRCTKVSCRDHTDNSSAPFWIIDGQHRLFAAWQCLVQGVFGPDDQISFALVTPGDSVCGDDKSSQRRGFKELVAKQFYHVNSSRESLDDYHLLFLNRYFQWPGREPNKIKAYDVIFEMAATRSCSWAPKIGLFKNQSKGTIQWKLDVHRRLYEALNEAFDEVYKRGLLRSTTSSTVRTASCADVVTNYLEAWENIHSTPPVPIVSFERRLQDALLVLPCVIEYQDNKSRGVKKVDFEASLIEVGLHSCQPEIEAYSKIKGEKEVFVDMMKIVFENSSGPSSVIGVLNPRSGALPSWADWWKTEPGRLSNFRVDYGCNCGSQSPLNNTYTGPLGGSKKAQIDVKMSCPVCSTPISNSSQITFDVPPNVVDINVDREHVTTQKVTTKNAFIPLDKSGKKISLGSPLEVAVELTSFGKRIPIVDTFEIIGRR